MAKVLNLINRSKSKKKHFFPFMPSLLISFISIILLCTLIMGILSYNIVKTFMTDQIIESNNKLLNQYKSGIDIALVQSVDNISSQIVRDLTSSYYLNRYFQDPLEHSIVDTAKVSEYLADMSVQNPLVFSLAIYYENNNLLVSTDYVRHTLYDSIESQDDLSHYYDIIQKASDYNLDRHESLSFFFDYGESLAFKISEVQANKPPETVIHAVRVVYGYNRAVRGAVIVTVSGDIFKNFLSKHAPEGLGSIFIVNKDGNIISHTDSSIIGHNITELGYEELLKQNNENGYFVGEAKEGLPAVFSYQTSLYNDWMYVSVAPMDEIVSVTKYILKLLILVALTSILVGALASFSRAKMLAKPMKNIVSNIKKSPYYSKQAKGNNEYSLINSTINNMENIMREKEVALQKVLPMIRMNFLSALFSSNPPDISEINARMRMMDIEFLHKFFCVAVVKLEKLQESEKVVLYEYEKLQICSKLQEMFTTDNSICLYYEKDNTIKVLVNFDFEESILYKLGEEFFKETQKLSSEGISISKYMSFGKSDTNLQHMSTSHKIAMNGLNYSYVFPEKYIFSFYDIINLEEKRSYSNRLLLKNLSNSLKSFNCEKSINDIGNLINHLRSGSFSYQQIYTSLRTCVSLIEDFLTTHVGQEIDLDTDFKNTANILEYEIWTKKIICKAFSDIKEADSNNNIVVMKAQEFIMDNIQNPQLSLEYVAKELNINYKYLSRVFKNETGVKFIDYVTNLKLNHCRNLLINTNLKVEEISDIMKYSSPQYFISRFKIMFGCTPKQYRENYQDKEKLDEKIIVE